MEARQKTMLGVITRISATVCLGYITGFSAQLPPEMLVDKYLLQATMLSEEKNYKGALEAMDRIVTLQKEHNLTLPEDFPFHYAQTALAAGSVQAAMESATQYLSVAGKEGKHYREALELLVKAEREVQEPDPDPVAPTLEKPDLEPQPQAVPPPVLQAQKTTAAQPAVDCRKWNTKKFFEKATVQDVRACLEAGAELEMRSGSYGWGSSCPKCTPLLRATLFNDNPAVIETLLKAGADLMARDEFGRTPLHTAASNNNNPEVIETLLKAGADPMAKTTWKRTPLHNAARFNENPAVITALLKAGADLEAQNKSKETPLHGAAISNDNPEVVKTLIDAGANQMAWNKKGKTPLQVARKRNRKVLRNAWATISDSQKAAHHARVLGKQATSGPSFLDVAVGVAGGAAIATAGGGTEEAFEAGTVFAESVIAGTQPAASSGRGSVPPTGTSGATTGGSPCQVPGYPNPPGGVANLGFSWCPASVGMQVRTFALQAAGAQCAIATGSSSTLEQIEARRREIRAACDRLAALGQSNCQCPPGLGQ